MAVRKSGDQWVADFKIDGKRKYLTRASKAEAIKAEKLAIERAAWEAEVYTQSFTIKEARDQTILRRWMGTPSESNMSRESQEAVDFFGPEYALARLTAMEVERYRDHLRRLGNKPATINRKVSAISSMLNDAALYGQITAVPKLPTRLKMDNTKDRVMTMEEEVAFRQTFRVMGHQEYADLTLFLVEMGCRFSEAQRCITNHVNTTHRTISFFRTKNSNPRTNPCTETLWNTVERLLPSHRRGHLFPDLSYGAFNYQWNRVKGKLGLESDLELTPHCLRHTCASRMIRYCSTSEVMVWGGWKSLGSMQRYLHLNVEGLANAKRALETERALFYQR